MSLQNLVLIEMTLIERNPRLIRKMASIIELHLARTAIAEFPESIGHLQNLRILDIIRTHIRDFAGPLGMLGELQELGTLGCENLEGLPLA